MVQRKIESALITGGTGYIGSLTTDFLRRGVGLPEVQSCSSTELDVTDRSMVADRLDQMRPGVVFHLAARAETDWCEHHFQEAKRVNVDGSVNVVEECLARDIPVVYFSSACLYPDNSRAYAESDEMRALCEYTRTKLLAEQELQPHMDRLLNIRMRQPFSNHRHPRNLLQKLASYEEFIDDPNSMSHLEECIPIIWDLCRAAQTGPFNIVNEGWTTPLRIARLIKKHWEPQKKIRQVGYEELLERLDAHRVNSLVDCSKLQSRGYELLPVEEAVEQSLRNPCGLGEYDWSRSMP